MIIASWSWRVLMLVVVFLIGGGGHRLLAQTGYDGWWTGYLTQGNDTFALAIHLSRTGALWSGQSVSKAADGQMGRFMITATQQDTGVLLVQEIKQLVPENEKWCIKYFRLHHDSRVLRGTWGAKGCGGGYVFLQQGGQPEVKQVADFSPSGKWTGRLTQSDRDYGFYFELEIDTAGLGKSRIVSEGSGGQAWHALQWSFDTRDSTLKFGESKVLSRTEASWKWCIKQSDLRLLRRGGVDSLLGTWSGQIEGTTDKAGRCAPGRLYLSRTAPASVEEAGLLYGLQTALLEEAGARSLSVQHQIDVSGPDIRLQVWDNGMVDGDVVSLFLNGDKLMNRIGVQKKRHSVQVHLEQDLNLLVVVADDIGTITPNTVAISVYDGQREQILIMNADMKENGGVVVRQFRRPE